ncbi:MAG: hypothetical protein WBB55_07125, partial [Anaerolineales bacterium]
MKWIITIYEILQIGVDVMGRTARIFITMMLFSLIAISVPVSAEPSEIIPICEIQGDGFSSP